MSMKTPAGGHKFAAHELIAMNEALMTKTANAELLSHFGQQTQDQRLADILHRQAQAVQNQYLQGVQLLQSQNASTAGHATVQMAQTPGYSSGQPMIGLHKPSMPAPQMGATISDRALATVVLNLHKHGAVGWMTLALECVSPNLRRFLVDGALSCDQMAYETWMYMNEKGYYQVPALQDNTTQTMIQAWQVPQANPQPSTMQAAMMQQQPYQ